MQAHKTNCSDYKSQHHQYSLLLMVHLLQHKRWGLITEVKVKVPVQELGSQRVEGTYFWDDMIIARVYR